MLMHGFLTKSARGWVLLDEVVCYAMLCTEEAYEIVYKP